MQDQNKNPEIVRSQDVKWNREEARLTEEHLFDTVNRSPAITPADVEDLLTNRSWRVRAIAVRALSRLEESVAIPFLLRALDDEHKSVRIAALEVVADFASYIPVAQVEAMLDDKEWSVQSAAAWTLGHFAGRIPVAHLLAFFQGQDNDVMARASALYAVSSFVDSAPIPHIIAALNDPEWHIREVAALSLGKLQVQSAVEPLIKRLRQDDDAFVKIAIAHALATLGVLSPDVIAALQAVLNDEDEEVRQAAEQALGFLTKRSCDLLLRVGQSTEMRQMAVRVLPQLRDYVSDETLIATLECGGEPVKREILTILNAPDQEIDSTPIDQVPPILRKPRHAKNVEFIPLTPSDLSKSPPIISQAMDNQWVPRPLLQLIMEKKLTYDDVAPYVEKQVRTEYIRSLINGRNVVINRAFFYNNPVVFNDFQPKIGHNRNAFKKLLDTGVVLPFLFNEQTPDEAPRYSSHPEGLTAWQEICQEVRMRCVRFDWDDDATQKDQARKLSQRFHQALFGAITNDVPTYARAFGLTEDQIEGLDMRLDDLSKATREVQKRTKDYVKREDIYKEFVTADNTSPSQRLYDGSKPFASEIKQYSDLVYNANLADALNGYLLTPKDTLPRSALQEWDKVVGRRDTSQFNVSDIIKLVRRQLFDLVQSDLYFKSMRWLSLEDVLAIRQMEEWDGYVNSLDTLLNGDLEKFGMHAPVIYQQYTLLMQRVTAMLKLRYKNISSTNFTAAWDPTPTLEVDIGGAKASFVWGKGGASCTLSGLQSPVPTPERRAPFIARLKVGGSDEALIRADFRTNADLRTNVDFMKGRLDDVLEQWKQLRMELPKIMVMREHYTSPQNYNATINEQEAAD